jgi:methyl-accepting chemotaxis protein
MTSLFSTKFSGQSVRYAVAGFLLGVSAPVGWGLTRLIFFPASDGLFKQLISYPFSSPEIFSLHLYMGLGTSAVLAFFGYLIGSYIEQIQQRASSLDNLNIAIAEQKTEYERRFRELNFNLKNFHTTNANIQNSLDPHSILTLATDSLHEILRYDRVNLLMLNREKNEIEFVATSSDLKDNVTGIVLPYDERAGAIYKALSENRFLLVNDVRSMTEEYHLQPPCNEIPQLRSRSFIICPITLGGEPIGVLGVDNKVERKTLNDTDLDTVRLFADQVSASLNKISLLEGVEKLTGELQQTFDDFLQYRSSFFEQLELLRNILLSATKTIGGIAESAEAVSHSVDETSSASSQVHSSTQEIMQNLGQLNEFMEQSISAMNEISASVQEVEKNASRSKKMSEKVCSEADRGATLVAESYEGLQGISLAVDRAVATIEFLAQKGEEIKHTVQVINEINQKTNLLSLNASIIAAQSGEHGKSFAVVAEEIRKLSLETSSSAEAIESLILEIGTATTEAVSHIGETRELVDKGIDVGKDTSRALGEIIERATPAMNMTDEILKATQEQVRSSQFVSQSIEELGQMSGQVSISMREQTQAITRIVQNIEEVKSMAEEMAAATSKNLIDTQNIHKAVDEVEGMAGHIFSETEKRQDQAGEMIQQVKSMRDQRSMETTPSSLEEIPDEGLD